MISPCRGLLLAAALCFVLAASAQAAAFDFESGPTYKNVASTETYVEFRSWIRSNLPSGDNIHVQMNKHLPETWFAQFCQTSTGICYFADADIELRSGENDSLRFDFFIPEGDENKGWMEVRISRVNDPTTYVEATFAVGHGVVLPVVVMHFTTDDAFHRGNPGDTIEMLGDLESGNSFDDQLLVNVERAIPAGWFSQFCQVSTGICYFGDEVTIDLPRYADDQLRVDFFTDAIPATGVLRLKVHSLANPAFWQAIPFRAETGTFPAAAEDGSVADLQIRLTPNPVRDGASVRFALQHESPARLSVLDLAGRTVATREATLPAGTQEISWDGADDSGLRLPSGQYFYRLEADGKIAHGKLTVQR